MKKKYVDEEHIHWKTLLVVGILLFMLFFAICWNNRYYDKQIEKLNEKIESNDLPLDDFKYSLSNDINFKWQGKVCTEVPCDCHKWGCALYCMECEE